MSAPQIVMQAKGLVKRYGQVTALDFCGNVGHGDSLYCDVIRLLPTLMRAE